MIREATEADIPRLLGFARRFHEAAQQPFGFDEAATDAFIAGLIEQPHSVVLIGDAGMIGGALVPAYCQPAWVMAVELAWWAERDGLRLLRAFEEWATDNAASEVRMTSLAALPRADAILRRKGYGAAEISYRKVI